MNPDVARAIPDLVERGLLPSERAAHLSRIHEGRLVSVHAELRMLLYGGVLLVAGGVGLLLHENFQRIGPAAIALLLGVAIAGCFAWLVRAAPPFDWGEVPSPNLAFDYVLLLAVLLTGSELVLLETGFAALGPRWPWHLLVLALITAAVAIRFDSRTVFSLALSTFTAWRGFSTSQLERALWGHEPEAVLLNAGACGVTFILVAEILSRSGRKPHFAPVARHLGWLLFLGATLSGALDWHARSLLYAALAVVSGAALAAHSYRRRNFPLFAYGTAAVYLAVGRAMMEYAGSDFLVLWWFLLSSVGLVAGLWKVHQKLKEPL
jgi:hypothetical protein